MRAGLLHIAAVAMLAAALAGCGSAPAKPAEVKARISATDSINPNSSGRPSPIHVRIFQLKESGAFLEADFWALVDKETETLGASLVQRLEFDMVPGESRNFPLKVSPEARVLGVMAEYADYRNAQWRVAAQAPNKTLTDLLKKDRVTIGLDSSKVSIEVGD